MRLSPAKSLRLITGLALVLCALIAQGADKPKALPFVKTISTVGKSGVRVTYNVRDIDGSANDAVQPVTLQYRLGSTGEFADIPGGSIADATSGPNLATLVTPVSVTLPAACDDQSVVQLRVITTASADQNDERVGVEEFSFVGTELVPAPAAGADEAAAGETESGNATPASSATVAPVAAGVAELPYALPAMSVSAGPASIASIKVTQDADRKPVSSPSSKHGRGEWPRANAAVASTGVVAAASQSVGSRSLASGRSANATTAPAILRKHPTLGDVPQVSLYTPTATSPYEAYLEGYVDFLGSGELIQLGFAYSSTTTAPEPGGPDSTTVVGSGSPGYFAALTEELFPNTLYHVVAYATTTEGTGLSYVDAFKTPCTAMEVTFTGESRTFAGAPYTLKVSAEGAEGGPFTYSFREFPDGLAAEGDTLLGDIEVGAEGYYRIYVDIEGAGGCIETVHFDLGVGTPVSPGDVVISEFRTHGIGDGGKNDGSKDEYIEIGNRTGHDIVVVATDGSGGWSLGRRGQRYASIPDGTFIPKGGHWLGIGQDFSLCKFRSEYEGCSVGDEDLDVLFEDPEGPDPLIDIPDDLGIGLFITQNVGSYSDDTRLDAVAGALETDELMFDVPLDSEAPDPYEGRRLALIGDPGRPVQTAWVRRQTDTGSLANRDDASDFVFVATDAGTYGPDDEVQAVFGSPNPEDSYSPKDVLQFQFPNFLFDPARAGTASPNRKTVPGRIEFRRKFENLTGEPIIELKFKVTNLTTEGTPKPLVSKQADLRIVNSSNETYPVGTARRTELHNPPFLIPGAEEDSPLYPTGNGGVNSLLDSGLGFFKGERSLLKKPTLDCGTECYVLENEDTINLNFAAQIVSGGYFLFVMMPQVTFFEEEGPCECQETLQGFGRRSAKRTLRARR